MSFSKIMMCLLVLLMVQGCNSQRSQIKKSEGYTLDLLTQLVKSTHTNGMGVVMMDFQFFDEYNYEGKESYALLCVDLKATEATKLIKVSCGRAVMLDGKDNSIQPRLFEIYGKNFGIYYMTYIYKDKNYKKHTITFPINIYSELEKRGDISYAGSYRIIVKENKETELPQIVILAPDEKQTERLENLKNLYKARQKVEDKSQFMQMNIVAPLKRSKAKEASKKSKKI